MFSTHDQKPNVSPSFGTSKGVAGSTLDIVSARVTRCVAGGHPVAMMHQLLKKQKRVTSVLNGLVSGKFYRKTPYVMGK